MKLYTEEQMAKIWMAGQKYWETSGSSITFEELLENEKPIELTRKTAMQELIDELEYKKNQFSKNNDSELIDEIIKPFYDKLFNALIDIIKNKLEKEKEQIIAAGYFLPHDEQNEIKTPEEYYNQTYNQNK